jgi:hypothetical protein
MGTAVFVFEMKSPGVDSGLAKAGLVSNYIIDSAWERHTDKKENLIFLIYKKIKMGSGAKSYKRKGLPIYEEAVSHMWLCAQSLCISL